MRHLNRPSPAEELAVRGRYECTDADGQAWGNEAWEWYRYGGSQGQVWRSQWTGERQGQPFTLLGHAVFSPEGLERIKMRLERTGHPPQNITLTTLAADSLLAHYDEAVEEVDLPVGHALFAPQPSLARLAFPFDLASEQRELAMAYTLRPSPPVRPIAGRPVKFAYTPLGLQEFTVKGQTLRAKSWRMEVPGLPTQEAWFERNGTCLLWSVEGSWSARLVEWQTFG